MLDLNDKTSNGNTLTNNGGDEVTTDLPFAASTKAVQLVDTNSDNLTAANHSSISFTSTFTFELWIKFTDMPASHYWIGGKLSSDAANGWTPYIYNSAGTYWLLIELQNGAANYVYVRHIFASAPSGWHHYAFVVDASQSGADKCKMYIDGSIVTTDLYNSGGTLTSLGTTTGAFTLGIQNNASANYLDGFLDDVRLWNDVRTATEIADNYNVHLTGSEAGLVAYWPLEALITTSRKTLNGLAMASVKTINGLGIASVKTINGLA